MRNLLQPLKRLWRQSEGSATVEFVINTPVILFALVFAYEFGRVLFAYEALTSDVEAAVRYLSRVSDCASLTSTSNNAVNAQNIAECEKLPPQGSAPTACAAPLFPWNSSTGYSLTVSNVTPASFTTANFNTNGAVVQVQASLPFNLFFLPYIGIGASHTLVVSDQTRCVGN